MKHLILIGCISLCQTALFAQNCPPSTVKNVHIVQKGETLYSLSRLYKTTVAQLCELNNIKETDVLRVCAALDVVNPTATSKPAAVPESYNSITVKAKGMPYFKSNKKMHTARKGETLDMISEYYGYTRARLMHMNNMHNVKEFHVGQALIINDCGDASANFTQEPQADVPQSYSVVSSKSTAVKKMVDNSANNFATSNFSSTNYSENNYSVDNLYTTATHSGELVVNANYNWSPNYKRVIHVVSQDNMSQKETLESVGRLHGLTAAEVGAMNGLPVNTALRTGQKLIVEERLESLEASQDGFMSSNSMENSAATNYTTPPQYTTSLAEVPLPDNHTTAYLNNASTPTVNTTSMTPEEMKMVEEINLIRRNPAAYIVNIEKYIKELEKSGDNKSGIAAARELITELFATPNLSILQPLECIYSAGKKYGIETKKRGTAEHQSLDGSMPWDRITKACPSLKDGNENLIGGPANIRDAMILLLVDDGIVSRGHRRTILQKDWKYIACHKMGQVGAMPNYWVQQFGN